MKTRAGYFVTCAAALLTCSCASQADLDRARAEAAAARAEAAEAKTGLDALKAKADAEEKARADETVAKAKSKADAEAAKRKAATLEAELRTRWNQVGPAVAVKGFSNFAWPGPNAFPHPTFKGGSAEAYTAFAKVLVTFLETGDNFAFMAENDLFTTEFGFGGTGKIKIVQFATDLAKPGSPGAGDEATRKKLEALVTKMKAPRKV